MTLRPLFNPIPGIGSQGMVRQPAGALPNVRGVPVPELDAGQGATVVTNATQLLAFGGQAVGEIGNPYAVRFVEQKPGTL